MLHTYFHVLYVHVNIVGTVNIDHESSPTPPSLDILQNSTIALHCLICVLVRV